MPAKHSNKRFAVCLTVAATCLVGATLWAVLVMPETALAKKPPAPDPWTLADVEFVVHEGFGTEIIGLASEAAEWNYRTVFGTANVTVTLADGTVLDHKPFLMRFTDENTGKRYLAFRIGIQDGHQIKDRCSTPGGGIGDSELAIPFPETTRDPGDGTPWLCVLAGGVDENLDMLPGTHVILHLHVSNIPLIRIAGSEAGQEIGRISVGDIEFTLPQ